MPDWVVCAECNHRYEAGTYGFCPKCGGTARVGSGQAGARPMARRDPGRTRVQLGGVLLLLVGGLLVAVATTLLVNPSWSQQQSFAVFSGPLADPEQLGGDLILHVLRDGQPVAGANVTLTSGNTTVQSNTTDAQGRYNTTLHGYIAVNASVQVAEGTWVRHVLAPQGIAVEVNVDVAKDPQTSDIVAGPDSLVLGSSIAFLIMSVLFMLGGLAAVLVRWRGLALAGPIPFVAFMAMTSLWLFDAGVTMLLPLVLVAFPYILVVSGRSAFRPR